MRRILVSALSILLLPVILIGLASAAGLYDQEIRGVVVDSNGVPLSGVNITAENTSTGETFSVTTDQEGNYTLPLPLGVYNVTAHLENYTANITYSKLVVDEGRTIWANFTMYEILGTLTGYITNGTVPVPGATVHLRGDRNYSANSTIPLGAYTITDIEPGTYIVYVEKAGYWTTYYDKPLYIGRGDVIHLDLIIEEQPATVYGQVVLAGKGLEGVVVTLTSGSVSLSTVTDAEGNYTLSGIPAGTYTIRFSKSDFVTQEFTISLSPFESKRLDVSLERKGAAGSDGFIPGFDLPHSLMIVGLMLALITLIFSLAIRVRVERRPELLEMEEVEAAEQEEH